MTVFVGEGTEDEEGEEEEEDQRGRGVEKVLETAAVMDMDRVRVSSISSLLSVLIANVVGQVFYCVV